MSHILRNLATNTGTVRELLQFLRARKLWWLVPMCLVLSLFGLLMVVAQVSGVAPFVYSLF